MKKLFRQVFVVVIFITATSVITQAQSYKSFKPGASIGQDALIFTRVGTNDANTNFGNYENLLMETWTWNGNLGKIRSLLKFTELNTIPRNATILDATLILYGVPSDPIVGTWGNNYYPGAPLIQYPNDLYVQRILNSWAENTVTWNTNVQTTSNDQITIPPSQYQWNDDYIISNSTQLINLVGIMVANPNDNNGFMIKLQNEVKFRSFLFASSDNLNEKLWPEIHVTYCDPNFTYCYSANNPYTYTFSASATNGTHQWVIDGKDETIDPSDFSLIFDLYPGNHTICHTYTTEDGNHSCEECIEICVY